MKTSVLRAHKYTVTVIGPKKIENFEELRKLLSEDWISGGELISWGRKLEGPTYAADNLRYYRRWAKMSQSQLARAIRGKYRHHISEMELGKRPIGKAMAKRLAKAMCVDRLWRSFLTDV